jgi:hypothetical protein
MTEECEIVWLTEERIFAVLVNLGAYFSQVKYTRGGIDYEVQVSNDEFEFLDEYTTDYESE